MRIDVPVKEYETFDTLTYPFRFRKAGYAMVKPVPEKKEYPGSLWADIEIPSLNACIYLSYIPNPNLDSCLTSTLFFIQRHMPKATGVDERYFNEPDRKVQGYLYHVKGSDVASPYQFYITDSSEHFVRGSLYFNCVPNNDSLAPLIEFLKSDIDTLLSSWEWK